GPGGRPGPDSPWPPSFASTESRRPLSLRRPRRQPGQVRAFRGPDDDRPRGPIFGARAHGSRFLGLRVDSDDLAALQAFDLRLKPLRIDASRGPHVFRLEAPRFAGREVAKDVLDARDERPRIPGAVHAREDKGPHPADFFRREFTAIPADLEDPFKIPAPLLLT